MPLLNSERLHPSIPEARIALAHDWLVGLRGGERVLDRLAHLFGPTDLYTLVNDGRHLTEAIAACNVTTSPLQRLPGASGRMRRWYLPLMPWAVERLHVKSDIDLLISTSSAVMKSIKPPPGVPHLCYCHTPARYIWEQAHEYAMGKWGRLRGAGLKSVRGRFQRWDRRTAQRVTRFIANSEHTRQRIARCFEREADVIYPPVRTEFFTVDSSVERADWLLVVAAMEPYKRTELVVEAAVRGGFGLKVVGSGSQLPLIRRRATNHSNIEVLGRIDDVRLRDLYRQARALVFPQTEDFGMIAVEAQACGCPVIAHASGGAMEIVTDATGVLMNEQSAEAILHAVNSMSNSGIAPDACRRNAERFSEARFDAQVIAVVREMLDDAESARAGSLRRR